MGFAKERADSRWASGIVPFVIHSSIGNNRSSLAAVREAIDHWNSRTCIQLLPRQGQSDFVQFKEHDSACESPVGSIGGQQLISCDIDSGDFGPGSVMHEIGHAVGLYHEQQRPDRDLFVVVSSSSLNSKNHKKKNGLVIGPYDCGSIMHYGPTENEIQPRPGQCGNMGQRFGLSAADIAAVAHMYRFMRREDSANLAGEVSEIAVANHLTDGMVTAVRTGSGRLRLITWHVDDDGIIVRRSDSGNDAGKGSHIDIARLSDSRFVTASRDGSGNLKLISWEISASGGITRTGDSGDQAGEASNIRIVALSATRLVTASSIGVTSGRLRLISWRLRADGSLARLGDSENAAGEVGEIWLVALPGTFPRTVVTAVQTAAGKLKLITWTVPSVGDITRIGDSGNAAGAASLIRATVDAFGQVLTSSRTNEGELRVICWGVDTSGEITRLGDSGDQAGKIEDNSLVVHGGTRAISGIRTSSTNLRLIEWRVALGGAVARNGDSANQAGTSSRITLNATPIDGNTPVVSASRTSQGRLRLISWARC